MEFVMVVFKKKFILTFLTGEIHAGSVYTACWKLKAF